MQHINTILVKPEEKGRIISLNKIEMVELELVPGTAGYEYSHKRIAYFKFLVGNIKEIEIFPGKGGSPGKDGLKSYVKISPNQYEWIKGAEGSGFPKPGCDGYIKVNLYNSLV
jgi:hypothetical protein